MRRCQRCRRVTLRRSHFCRGWKIAKGVYFYPAKDWP